MTSIDKSSPVMVTGGAGYLASWVIKTFLDQGYSVHATVRDRSREDKVGHLLTLATQHDGRLTLFEADLLNEGSFAQAMQGCQLVVHTASPFSLDVKDPQKQLVEPALQGTRNVLQQANQTETVRRVVLTSSVAAIYGDIVDLKNTEQACFTEAHWNSSSSLTHLPYSYSKTLAERAAWEMAKEQSAWDLVVINPGFIFGPSLSTRVDGGSADFLCSLLNGKLKTGVADLRFSLVDVREVARAHLEAGTRPDAEGRHILVNEVWSMLHMADALRETYGESHSVPRKALPKWLTYLVGPFFGLSWRFVARNVGRPLAFDNSRSKERLGLSYRPVSETLLEHAAQLVDDGLV